MNISDFLCTLSISNYRKENFNHLAFGILVVIHLHLNLTTNEENLSGGHWKMFGLHNVYSMYDVF